MTIVGGFDVHREQITFDYVDDDGVVRWGRIRPATRSTLRRWLAEHCPDGDGEFALEGCTGWQRAEAEGLPYEFTDEFPTKRAAMRAIDQGNESE